MGGCCGPRLSRRSSNLLIHRPPRQMPGVSVVRDGEFIGVTAPDALGAEHALNALRAKWTARPQPSECRTFDYLRKNARRRGRTRRRARRRRQQRLDRGGIESRLAQIAGHLYHRLHRPHSFGTSRGGRALGGRQAHGLDRHAAALRCPEELAQALDIPQENVRVIVPDTGSGYGGKQRARRLSKRHALPRPPGNRSKWSGRVRGIYLGLFPAGWRHRYLSGVREDGTISAWEFHNYNSGGSGIAVPYDIAESEMEFLSARNRRCARVRIAGWRRRPIISRAKATLTI